MLTTVLYMVSNFSAVFTHTKSTINTSTLVSKFSQDDVFTQDDGFRIAFGLQSRSDFGLEFEVVINTWDYTKEPLEEIYTQLELHACTDEELKQFYPIELQKKKEFQNFKDILKCFDHSKVKLAGNYDSSIGSLLNLNIKIKNENCKAGEHFSCYGDADYEK